jgi:hypothetical protein
VSIYLVELSSLVHGDHVQGVVQFAVAGQREPVSPRLLTRHLDGRDTRVGSEVPFAREPADVPNKAYYLCGEDRTNTEDFGERRCRRFDLLPDRFVEPHDLSVEGTNVTQQLGG